jgi:hypothetical protein
MESSWWGYNFAIDLIVIGGPHRKLWASKVAGVPTMGISGLPFGSPRTKCHWMWPPWRGIENNIRGKVVASPQVWAVVNLVSSSCPWLILAPKMRQLYTNHLVLVLCRVWVSEACQFFLLPSRSSSTPLYPSKVLRAKEHASTLALSLFFVWDSHLGPSRSSECVIMCGNPTLKECEDDTHIPEMGTWESSKTPENSEFNCKGQNTSPWAVLYTVDKGLEV